MFPISSILGREIVGSTRSAHLALKAWSLPYYPKDSLVQVTRTISTRVGMIQDLCIHELPIDLLECGSRGGKVPSSNLRPLTDPIALS